MSLSNDPASAPGDAGQATDVLTGRRILIVEDDPFIALALEETLREHGLIIAGVARKLKQALNLIDTETFDLALLDVNIGDDKIDPVADLLAARNCPFIFTTGYGRAGLPETHASRMIVEKPFYIDEVLTALRSEFTSGPRNG